MYSISLEQKRWLSKEEAVRLSQFYSEKITDHPLTFQELAPRQQPQTSFRQSENPVSGNLIGGQDVPVIF